MQFSWSALCVFGAGALSCLTAAEPRLLSVHPFTVARGTPAVVTVRGTALEGLTAVFADTALSGVKLEIAGIDREPPNEVTARSKTPAFLLRLRVDSQPDTTPGILAFRLAGPSGVSNSISLQLTDHPVIAEPEGAHDSPEAAIDGSRIPALYTGRVGKRGEADYYVFEAAAGETLTLQVLSGLPSIGAAGSNATGFDPSIAIFEPGGSWFDPKRLNRLAFNDEPLWMLGRGTDAHLTHRFAKAGRYYARVEAFSGQGGPDYSYQLKIVRGEAPPPGGKPGAAAAPWEERAFPRHLAAGRLNDLAERGGKPRKEPVAESYGAGAQAFKLPGTLEGSITQPGESYRASFEIDGPRDIAIEVETPAAAPPLFNPVVRLLDAAGQEVATNAFAGRGACTGALNKSLQAKTIVPLRNPGRYTIEVRDVTADLSCPDFRYRVMVRPQIAHVGQIKIDEEQINLAQGAARTMRVTFDREEDFRGALALSVEGLPDGVTALAAADYEPDKDQPMYTGKRERYVPRTERMVVALTADPTAPVTSLPRLAKLTVRPVVSGVPGAALLVKQIPVMVVAKP